MWATSKPTANKEDRLTTRDACKALGCSANTLRKYRTQGYIKAEFNLSGDPFYTGEQVISLWEKKLSLDIK